MNKYYPTKEIVAGWLTETKGGRTLGGIKNIIGIVMKHNNESLFYSILDDCFFRILPSKEEPICNDDIYSNKLFVEVYDIYQMQRKTLGVWLYERLKKEYITKKDIIGYKSIISGHYSDLDYPDKIELDTKVDYEDNSITDSYIIISEGDYREKLGRLITYDENCIYGPVRKKIL